MFFFVQVLRDIGAATLYGPRVAAARGPRASHLVGRCAATLPAAVLGSRAALQLRAGPRLLRAGLR